MEQIQEEQVLLVPFNANGNAALTIEDGDQRMILGSNGFRVDSSSGVHQSAIIGYNAEKNYMYIGSADQDKPINVCIQGNLVDIYNKDKLEKVAIIEKLQDKIVNLEQKLQDVTNKLEMVYYAPGMPGYILAESEYLEHTNEMKNISTQ